MKTYTQLLNEIGLPKMNRALNQRFKKTLQSFKKDKNVCPGCQKMERLQNLKKLGRTSELMGKKASQSPSILPKLYTLGMQTMGKKTQDIANKGIEKMS